MNKFKEILPYVIVIILVILLRQFIITPIQVVGSSMNPNLVDGELMLLNKITYKFNENYFFIDIRINNIFKRFN